MTLTTLLITLLAASGFTGFLIWNLLRAKRLRLGLYDPDNLRTDMIASAQNEEERRYLEEMDALDLHRRHLVC